MTTRKSDQSPNAGPTRPLSALAARAHRRAVRRRWARRGVALLVIGLVALVAGVYVARAALTRGVALATIERALGYEATCDDAELTARGRVRLPNLTLRAPGVAGEAGAVLETEWVELRVDWLAAALSPADAVRAIHLHRPVALVSVDVRDNTLNLSSRSAPPGGGDLPEDLPPIRVSEARLIVGEHGDGWFAPLDSIVVSGVLAEPSAGSDVYELRLTEETQGGRTPAVLQGQLDLARGAGSFRLVDVDFGALHVPGVSPPVMTTLRRLRVDGRLPEATLAFEPDGTFEARLALDGVDVILPAPVLNPRAASGDTTRPLDLAGVTGEVVIDERGLHADLIGLFEDVDARVVLDTEGFGADANAVAEFIVGDYTLGPNPALLPYAPELAAEFLRRFSGPEAEVSGRVKITRRDGDAAASGLFAWRNGSAAFEGFPYPVGGITGRLSFDADGVYVTDLLGAGPSGAEVRAEIVASPIGSDAEIEAQIVATNVPLDEHLFRAIGEDRGRVVGELFDAASLAPGAREIAERAGFSAGGSATLDIEVAKRGGEFGTWSWDVTATGEDIGLTPEAIGYPLVARTLELRLDRRTARVQLPDLRGPTGARGSATVDVVLRDEDGSTFEPRVAFELERAPIDELALAAAAGRSARLGEILGKLRASGEASATGEATADDAGTLGVRASVGLLGVELATTDDPRARIHGIDGEVRLENGRASVTAEGTAFGGAAIGIRAEAGAESGEWTAEIDLDELELTPGVATFVGAFAPEAGAELASLIERRAPRGTVDVRNALASSGGEAVWSAAASDLDGFSVLIDDERLTVTRSAGRVEFDGESGLVAFDGFAATIRDESGASVRVGAEGALRREGSEAASLSLRAEDLVFESPLVRRSAAAFGGEGVALMLAEADPAGRGDLEVTIEAPEGEAAVVRGVIRPRRLALNRGGERLAFERVRGLARFDDHGVLTLEGLEVESDGWSAALGGRLEGERFFGDASVAAREATPALLAALPEGAGAIARTIELRLEPGGELRASSVTDDAGGVTATVTFAGAAMDLGVPIESATGELELSRPGEAAGGDEALRPLLTGRLRLSSFTAASAPMRDGRAELRWDQDTRTLEIPSIAAACGTGIIQGRGRLAPTVGAVEGLAGGDEFLLDLRSADVPLVWFVDRPEDPWSAPAEELASRGLIAGRFTVRGGVGDSDLPRVGRGEFAIRGGEVLRLPLLTPALELLNLQPPVGERLAEAAIEFGLVGDRLVFDRLFVRSSSIVVDASGSANLGDRTLDLQVTSRGRRTIPFVSDLVNALRDELAAARVTGPIGSPRYEVVQLPNARRVLLGAIAPGAGGSTSPTAPPARPPVVESVPLRLEPIDE